jgi:DNA topoisomerase-1
MLAQAKADAMEECYNQKVGPLPQGHIQATGRDGKGRKEYRYHVRWHAMRDETKYDRMICFGEALSLIRERTMMKVRTKAE